MDHAFSLTNAPGILRRRTWIVPSFIAGALRLAAALLYVILPRGHQSGMFLIINKGQNASQAAAGVDHSQIQMCHSLTITYADIIPPVPSCRLLQTSSTRT